jgi:hypothetical protein
MLAGYPAITRSRRDADRIPDPARHNGRCPPGRPARRVPHTRALQNGKPEVAPLPRKAAESLASGRVSPLRRRAVFARIFPGKTCGNRTLAGAAARHAKRAAA